MRRPIGESPIWSTLPKTPQHVCLNVYPRVNLYSRALQWGGNPYGNGYGVEMEWKWGTICENRMDWIGFGAECSLNTM